ncbi:MAG: ABC transporter substrate-binding protein, partial [Clostridia bacterium]|nr:ABC transporter substrate-binding protein [Clostridia bacterium]
IHQGEIDYINLINERGGLKGYRLEPLVVDNGNEPQRGLENYEQFKSQGAIVFNFFSTPVAAAVIPRALEDKIIVASPLTGRSDATDGQTFPYVFPLMATYWSQAAGAVDFIAKQEGGNLQGKKIGLVHIDSPFGREPIPILQALSQKLGFQLGTFAYPSPGTEQSAAWTQVRQFKPDWILIWGAGASQPVSVKAALQEGFPLDHVVSVPWLAETDINIVGPDRAKGIRRIEAVAIGREPKPVQDVLRELYAKGKGAGKEEMVGTTYYNVGLAATAAISEGIRLALEKGGEPLTGDKLKEGFESLKNFDAGGLMPPITVTPEDHEGGGWVRIGEWDGTKWVPKSDWVSAYRDVVLAQVKKSAEAFRQTGK